MPEPMLFVTGTDTGVGKTVVTGLIARALRGAGRSVRVCKPVATGAGPDGVADDTRALIDAAGGGFNPTEVTEWSFPEPAAPPVAARLAGARLSLGEVAAAVRRRGRAGALLLVEGVGGLLCPLTERHTVADLVGELRCPCVVVARRSLGTLNHTLLTLEAAAARGLDVRGVVVSETEPAAGAAAETNVDELRRYTAVPVLAVVPHRAGRGSLAGVDWWSVARGE